MTSLPNCYRCKSQPCTCADGITIYNADCREVLSLLEPGSVDLVLTDPPYGIPHKFGVHEHQSGKGSRRLQFDFDEQVVIDDVRSGLTMSFAICQPRASCFVWVGFETAGRYSEPAARAGFTVKPAAWVKKCPPPAGEGNWWPSAFELAYYGYRKSAWFGDTNPKRSNVWVADSYRHGQPGKVDHPTQKPLGLITEHLTALARPDALVLDPFSGSGTTGRACKDLGRKCIQIELEEKYCEIAANRLEQEVLFT